MAKDEISDEMIRNAMKRGDWISISDRIINAMEN